MKISEITNAQDQLALLRTIIDNTWGAIKQQADAEARQTSAKKMSPNQGPKPAAPKKGPHAPAPKPLPTPKPIRPQAQQNKNLQPLSQPEDKVMGKGKLMPSSPKPLSGNIISPINHNRSEKERQEMARMARGEEPWKPL